ncbi:MAG TPA: DUF5060 domain-containing protein [Bacteroidales bacterium]|nr:DUF5060 domain-containing protein [Bacteroidales bacterium]
MKHTRLILLFTMGIGIFFSSPAQIRKVIPSGKSASQYSMCEWTIHLEASWNNPYDQSDVALNMLISTPSGKSLTLPCYYESVESGETSVWKARFAPAEKGNYRFRFELLKGTVSGGKTEPKEFTVAPSDKNGFLHVNNYWTFKFDNGKLFRGIGENIGWESRDSDDSKFFENLHENPRYNYDFMLKKLAANGGNFFRTWMIYWNLPVDWKAVKNNRRYTNSVSPYNESAIKRMDRLTQLCDSLGIYMMLALESHAGFGSDAWEMNNYNVKNGGYAKTPLEFFTLPAAKAQYKNKLRFMVARFGYSPSIGAWEFFNEIDNVMYQGKPEDRIPDSVITAWHNEMSTYLHEIDPYGHIVTTSISHRDVKGMNDLPYLDVNQKHIYKNTDAIPATLRQYSGEFRKPYIIGEFGYEWDWSKNFNDFADNMDDDFRRGLWLGMFSPTPVLPMSWWWEFFENRGMMEYFKNVRTFSDTLLSCCGDDFKSFEVSGGSKDLQTYGLSCNDMHFVYCYNTSPDAENVEFTCSNLPVSNKNIRIYRCESGEFNLSAMAINGNMVKLDDITIPPRSGMVIYWESK